MLPKKIDDTNPQIQVVQALDGQKYRILKDSGPIRPEDIARAKHENFVDTL